MKYPRFEKFLDYMIRTWIGDEDERIIPMFHRKIWNHWGTDMETRTNNNNEGYNHRLQK